MVMCWFTYTVPESTRACNEALAGWPNVTTTTTEVQKLVTLLSEYILDTHGAPWRDRFDSYLVALSLLHSPEVSLEWLRTLHRARLPSMERSRAEPADDEQISRPRLLNMHELRAERLGI